MYKSVDLLIHGWQQADQQLYDFIQENGNGRRVDGCIWIIVALSGHFIILITALWMNSLQSICILSQYMNIKLRLINFHKFRGLYVFKFGSENESLTGK